MSIVNRLISNGTNQLVQFAERVKHVVAEAGEDDVLDVAAVRLPLERLLGQRVLQEHVEPLELEADVDELMARVVLVAPEVHVGAQGTTRLHRRLVHQKLITDATRIFK